MTQLELAEQEERHLDALGSLALSRDLANDTIRIALNIVGINPDSLNQFERASVLLNMAQEYADFPAINATDDEIYGKWANGRGYNGRVYKERTA